METSRYEYFKEKLQSAWSNIIQKSNEDEIAEMGRERIVVFIVALILALCLWLMVNLSRDYNLNLELKINLTGLPQNKALAKDFPETATVSVTGEGWKLISLYNNPPSINISVNNSEVNLYDQVQQQMTAAAIELQKVQPLILTLDLEERITKKVPLRSNVDVSFEQQYDFLESPRLIPDSVSISGARSLIRSINEWSTDSVRIKNVSRNVEQMVPLRNPGELINLSTTQVTFRARVVQFTEGEENVEIITRNLPKGRNVSYSPSSITVKYDIPLTEYTKIKNKKLFNAYVTYQQIANDSTGFVRPQIEQVTDNYHIRVRSFQPRRTAYFIVLDSK